MPSILDKAVTIAEDPGPWSQLIYGDWGSGKTVLACGATKPILLNAERSGKRSLLNHPEFYQIPIIPIPTLSQAKSAANLIGADKDGDYQTVILDTVTTLQYVDMKKQMKELGTDRDPDLPSQAEFNKNNRRIQKLVDDLIESCYTHGRNLIILAHVKEEKDNEGMTTLIRPGTSPALTNAIAPMVDAVFYLEKVADGAGKVTRTLYTISTRKIKGKSRFDLPDKMVNPHFSEIEKVIDQQRQKALDLIQTNNNTESEQTNA